VQILLPFSSADRSRWDARPFSATSEDGPRPGDRQDRFAREVGIEPPGEPLADGPFRRARAAIFRYDVFPPWLMRPMLLRTPVQVGDTVGLRYLGFRVVHLFFAARIIEIFDGPAPLGWRSGFTYRTLEGHPELGEETFAVEKDEAGRVEVSLTSWSRGGLWLTRLAAPITRRFQVSANTAALDNLEARAR
jgi:uncharacterized protein (UPF0548 family)